MDSIDAHAEQLTRTNTELGHLYREQKEARQKLKLVGRQITRQERIRESLVKKLRES